MAPGHPRAWKRFATSKALPVQYSQCALRCGDSAAQSEAQFLAPSGGATIQQFTSVLEGLLGQTFRESHH